MFHWEDYYNEFSKEEVQIFFDRYCLFCRGSDLGDCDVCKEAFNKKVEGLRDVDKK